METLGKLRAGVLPRHRSKSVAPNTLVHNSGPPVPRPWFRVPSPESLVPSPQSMVPDPQSPGRGSGSPVLSPWFRVPSPWFQIASPQSVVPVPSPCFRVPSPWFQGPQTTVPGPQGLKQGRTSSQASLLLRPLGRACDGFDRHSLTMSFSRTRRSAAHPPKLCCQARGGRADRCRGRGGGRAGGWGGGGARRKTKRKRMERCMNGKEGGHTEVVGR